MSLKSRRRARRPVPPSFIPQPGAGEAGTVCPPQTEKRRKPAGGWWWRRVASRLWRGAPADADAVSAGAGEEAVELSEAGTHLAVRAGAGRSAPVFFLKTAIAALVTAFLALAVEISRRPDIVGAALGLSPPASLEALPRLAPSSLPYASRGVAGLDGKLSGTASALAPGAGMGGSVAEVAESGGASSAGPVQSIVEALKNWREGIASALRSSESASGFEPAGPSLTPPPGGFFAPGATPTNALKGFVAGDLRPGRHKDGSLAQAVAPGNVSGLHMGSLVNERSLALGQLRSAASLNASMRRAGEDETASEEGQAQFDNPGQAASVSGEGLAATGGGDGTGAGSVVNGPQGGGAPQTTGAPSVAAGLGACGAFDASRCGAPAPSANAPAAGAPWQRLLDKAAWAVGVGDGLLMAASVLALIGEMLGPYGWPFIIASYALAAGAAALGGVAIDLGVRARDMGAMPQGAWIAGILGGAVIAGAAGVFLGGPGAVAGLILGAAGLVGTVVTSLLGKF